MGAWGFANFENDAALDFTWEVEEKGASAIIEAIKKITAKPAEDPLDTDDECVEALAAIEFIAAAKGNPSEDLPENAEDWLAAYKGSELSDAALVEESQLAIDRIRTNSELKELWAETEDFATWENVLKDLKKRISA